MVVAADLHSKAQQDKEQALVLWFLDKRLGSKQIKMVYDVGSSKLAKNIPTTHLERIE